jgi:hypothetical protein
MDLDYVSQVSGFLDACGGDEEATDLNANALLYLPPTPFLP